MLSGVCCRGWASKVYKFWNHRYIFRSQYGHISSISSNLAYFHIPRTRFPAPCCEWAAYKTWKYNTLVDKYNGRLDKIHHFATGPDTCNEFDGRITLLKFQFPSYQCALKLSLRWRKWVSRYPSKLDKKVIQERKDRGRKSFCRQVVENVLTPEKGRGRLQATWNEVNKLSQVWRRAGYMSDVLQWMKRAEDLLKERIHQPQLEIWISI